MPTLYLPAALPSFLQAPLEASYECVREKKVEVEAIVVPGGLRLDPGVLGDFPKLGLISVFGVGYDGVPLDYCRERGIQVSNTPDVLTDDVADIAVGLVLMTSRRLGECERYVRAGRWAAEGAFPLTQALRGAVAGIVGLGRIGKAIAQRLSAFGMKIHYHGRSEQKVPWTYEPSLISLAEKSDFMILACPGGPGTQHLVNHEILRALGAEGVLINISRGSVVNEKDLIEALQEGRVGGAGLDVFEHEPQVPAALLGCERVVVLPHVGSATQQTRQAMADLVLANVRAFFSQHPLVTPVL